MKTNACSIAVILAIGFCHAPASSEDQPDWIASFGISKKFPDSKYFTGFGSSSASKEMSKNDKLAQAKGFAQAGLTQAIQVRITSENLAQEIEKTTNGMGISISDVRSTVASRTNLKLEGIKHETYTKGGKRDPVYVLAWMKRTASIAHYRKRFATAASELAQMHAQAQALVKKKDIKGARNQYLDCDRKSAELEEMIMVMTCLGASSLDQKALGVLIAAKAGSRQLQEKTAETIEEAAEQISAKIALQKVPAGKIQVNAPMIEDSYLYSQFSNHFRTVLERMISKNTKLTPINANEMDFTPQSANINRLGGVSNESDYVLSGSYFLQGDTIHLYTRLLTVSNNTISATADVLMKESVAKGMELKPKNYLQALRDRRTFGKGEVIGTGLSLESWTNRGSDNMMLEEGDKMVVYVRVNKPCYLRFLYHLANGAQVFPDELYQNYYIDENKVNRVVALPDTFEIYPPFGSETMQFFASTHRFPKVNLVTKIIDGEEYQALAGSARETTMKTRGLKKSKPAAGATARTEVAEKRITVTTVGR